MAQPSRIALFGGTFDPVHLGHMAMAMAAMEALKLDQVRFLPCHISPHKLDTPPTPDAQRMHMLELATHHHRWAVVDDFETHQDGPSYSWKTAETMRAHFPGSLLYWIMGSDQWEALERWDQPLRLAACVEFIVFHRGAKPHARKGYRLHPLPAAHPANASDIRRQLADGQKDHPWLDPEVAAYIEECGLYGTTS